MMEVDISHLAAEVLRLAEQRRLRIGVAESLTGGQLADALVSIPGASRAFAGGVVAYATSVKHLLLGVPIEQLRRSGPVDPDVARAMAEGVRSACATTDLGESGTQGDPPAARAADIGIATTGVAGPDPDPQTGQPVGTVWVAVSGPDGTVHERVLADAKDRAGVRTAAVRAALELALRVLRAAP